MCGDGSVHGSRSGDELLQLFQDAGDVYTAEGSGGFQWHNLVGGHCQKDVDRTKLQTARVIDIDTRQPTLDEQARTTASGRSVWTVRRLAYRDELYQSTSLLIDWHPINGAVSVLAFSYLIEPGNRPTPPAC